MSWKKTEQEKKKKVKEKQLKKELKPFEVKNYRFFPCSWSHNLKNGYVYYLMVRSRCGYLITHELDSPRFKSEEEAKNFVFSNKDYSFIPA